VHVDAAGLFSDRWYRYRFRLGGWTSPVGRARTAPPDDAHSPELTLAVASCQNWQAGYYTAYPHLVADGPDLVLWCGDYIYEPGAGGDGPRRHEGPAADTLEGYRNRYALYRSDPNLQAAHAACPWVVTWDDHEVVDNYASSVDSAGRGGEAFANRRAAAYRAWWEHMPVRMPPPEGPNLTVHRRLRWGKLASLLVLDGRQYRSPQPCGGGLADLCPARDKDQATMLGAQQEAWLAERSFTESAAAGVTWTVLVNQVVLADFVVPIGAGGREQANMDAWDGYPAARRRLLEAAKRAPVANLVVLTGDLHASMVNDLVLDGVVAGTEFVGPSISSTFPAARVSAFSLAPLLLPQVKLADARYRGYLLCRLEPGRCVTDYRWIRSVAQPTSELVSGAPRFAITAGRPGAAPA
jgi:alkaline phosphatase D